MTERGKRRLLFGLPIVLWMLVILLGSSTLGQYENSWRLTQNIVHWLAPEFGQAPLDVRGLRLTLSMYAVNLAVRRVAHVVLYAVLTALVVRGLQGGEPRLKRLSMIGAFGISFLYVGADELYRRFTPDRHAKWTDLILNLIGVFLVLTGTVVWFWFKNQEQCLLAAPVATPIPDTSSTTEDESFVC